MPLGSDQARLTRKAKSMQTSLRLFMIVVAGAWLAACNTSEGIGKDVKAAGTAIEKTAKKTKEKM
jgi:predicted small secreted protein